MKDLPIAFIGGGNMARSLIGGLLVSGADPILITSGLRNPTLPSMNSCVGVSASIPASTTAPPLAGL